MARDNERPDRGDAGEGRRGSDRRNPGRPFNSDRDGKKIFNRRDKYDRSEGRGERSERRSFGSDRRDNDRREGGERRPFNSDRPRREGGDRPFNADRADRRDGGERRSFNSDRPRRDDRDRRPFNSERTERREGGERRSFGDKREGGERRPFNGDRPERRSSDRGGYKFDKRDDRRGGERRSFGEDRIQRYNREGGERRFNSDKPDRRDNDRRDGGERRSFNSDRPRRDEGERRSFGGDRKPYRENRQERLGKQAPSRSRFADRNKEAGPEQEAPTYNLSRYKDNPRIKKSERDKEDDGTIRLNRFIANAGICSRREADSLIEAGEIKVNGEVVTEMGFKVQPTDTIQYGKKILNREKLVYVLLNKPKDFLTTTDDPEGRKTVMDLVSSASSERIFPVGRLDRNTTGLLLFTNDGELAQKLTHPSNGIKKIYQVELDKPITKADFQQVAEGVELEDGKAEVDDVALLGESNKFLGLEIHIGRNRIVRRIFEHLGYEVVTLDRVQYAGLTKKDLPRGNWRYLTEKEVVRLKYFM
ncbi:23S rRNA pseudouridine2605 synthase [Pontibacter ummariensis]|uniref:Pseudouridine synthase n=1 Tax=Pontibacter ummariensis TaxID=1610492 RepID=A0A239CH68_9BACT|nr:pseudouridine synthase [Pontibacter ummariensis]PRY15038.1 23S rRNA pseudouridine2605 synthase [Pontibacter ummariensis]SNS19008.1 23S rRNA pseudouridine2605 synthase [Pontibacter ummariensis]